MSQRYLTGDHEAKPDTRRINLDLEYEVLYWAHYFGVSPRQLLQIVRETGPYLRDVLRKLWR